MLCDGPQKRGTFDYLDNVPTAARPWLSSRLGPVEKRFSDWSHSVKVWSRPGSALALSELESDLQEWLRARVMPALTRLAYCNERTRGTGCSRGMWVREIKADAAFHPRIILAAGCPFMGVPAQTRRQPDAKAYRFATLGGQLRWAPKMAP